MKNRIIALTSLTALLGTGAYFGAQAQTNPTTVTPIAFGQNRAGRERHPEMMRALKTLERAKMDLQKANRDFGGHREKAVDLTQRAIDEVKAAIQFDKK